MKSCPDGVGWLLRRLFVIPVFASSWSVQADLSLICSPSVTVACDQAWAFTDPVPSSTCTNSNGYVDWQPFITVTSGVCPRVVTRTWTVVDYCGNTATCSQAVTLLDTNPPAALCSGINHVPNPSMESNYACPFFLGQVSLAAPWYPPSVATPDHYNTCTTNSLIGVPSNFAGSQAPLTGQAYLGMIVHRNQANDDVNSYREYLQVPLIAPLIGGQQYTVSFHVSLAENSPTAISTIGAHLSAGPVLLPSGNYVLPVTPQVVNAATNILNNPDNWVLIQGTYTAAGGEDHLTLGNYLNDTSTPFVVRSGTNDYSYYYVDDVSVVALCNPLVTSKVVECGSDWSFNRPVAIDPCSGTNVTVAVAGTVTNSACALQLIRTWKLTDPCGNSNQWSQTVTVQEVQPPVVLCECIAASAAALLTTNSCAGVVPDLSPYTYCVEFACGEVTITQDPHAGTVFGPGVYSITTRVESCSGSVSTCAVPFVVHPLAPVITVPTNLVVQTCSNTASVMYAVSAAGAAGPVVCTPPSGSVFTQGVTVVTCVATSACGGVATNTFTVTVRPPRARWFCNLVGVGVGVPYGPVGGTAAMIRTAPGEDYPSIALYPDEADPDTSGIVFNPGPAGAVRIGTVLDFSVPNGSTLELVPPADAMDPDPAPLVSFTKIGLDGYAVKINKRRAAEPGGLFSTVAVDTNGNLFNALALTSADASTNRVLVIGNQPGITNCHVVVELDLATGGVAIEFPGEVTPSARHKGWDGCIYGPDRPRPKPPKTARVVVVPPVSPGLPPMEEFSVRFRNGWGPLVVEEPSLVVQGRRWSDGHVTLMKAFDDGAEEGVEFTAAGPGGAVQVDLGHAERFSVRFEPMHGSDVPEPFQDLRMTGWPPLTTTNRPPPQTNLLRVAASALGSGFDLSADFTQAGYLSAVVQLWHLGALVGEAPEHPATINTPLVRLASIPRSWAVDGPGSARFGDAGPIEVIDGMDCGGVPCTGDELRIIGVPNSSTPDQYVYTGLAMHIREGMDLRVMDLQTLPACTNIPVAAATASGGVTVTWEGDGFRLQGAAAAEGPWYDLGVASPVTLSAGAPLRVFRLRCN